MNEIYLKVKKFFVKKQKKAKKKGVTGNPYKDWSILFGISVLLLIMIVTFNYYLFYKIQEGSLYGKTEGITTNIKKHDFEALNKIIKDQLGKEKIFEEVQKNVVTVPDPSK